MPLIVKLKRPGSAAAGALASGPVTPTEENTRTGPILEAHSIPSSGPSTPSLAAAAPSAETLFGSGLAHDAELDNDELDGPEHEIAMVDADPRTDGNEPMAVKQEPRTPPEAMPPFRNEDLKSPIDTAMQDSTPILEKEEVLPYEAPKELAVPPAAVDVLVAPACLQHRYVRSYDLSTVVERPERLRAVLLGVAAAIGRANTTQLTPAPRSGWSYAKRQVEAAGDDDLAHYLERLSLHKALHGAAPAVNVWLCNRSLALHPPDPSVAYVHAHPEEEVKPTIPEYAIAQGIALDGLAQVKVELAPPSGGTDTSPETKGVTFASYLAELCRIAPCSPPERISNDPDRTLPGPHPSEVPDDLSQGDLYLRGPSATSQDGSGGSGEAIRHALGACAEAVDRVVLASAAERLTIPQESAHTSLIRLPDDPAVAAAQESSVIPRPGPSRRNFVLTRPPGHHCSGHQPAGFCWTSNAVVAAAHAYIQHGIDRVIILDIDLHHGNGTQALAWRINNETMQADQARDEQIAAHRRALAHASNPKPNRHGGNARKATHNHDPAVASAASATASTSPPSALSDADIATALPPNLPPCGLKVFYGSLHDIESYPCETGDPELVRDASTCIEGAHGQWIWNVHLDSYASEAEFDSLYRDKYAVLFAKARRFASQTSASPSQTLLLLSAGFDACEHEYSTMSRHGRKVPAGFYARFAHDAVRLAEEVGGGKVVGLLEGGYSDRALCSAAMALVGGLVGYPLGGPGPGPGFGPGVGAEDASAVPAGNQKGCAEWWEIESLLKLEKAAKKMAATAAAAGEGGLGSGGGSAYSTPVAQRRRAAGPTASSSSSAGGGGGTTSSGGGGAGTASNPPWLRSGMAIFDALERAAGLRAELAAPAGLGAHLVGGGGGGGGGRVLRDRSKVGRAGAGAGAGAGTTPTASPAVGKVKKEVV